MANRPSNSSEDALRLETDEFLWTQSAEKIGLTLKNPKGRRQRLQGNVVLKIARRTRKLTLMIGKETILTDKQLFGEVVPQECWGVVHMDGEIDIILVKAHRTTNRAEWWPKVFVDDEHSMPGVPESASVPLRSGNDDRREGGRLMTWILNILLVFFSFCSLLLLFSTVVLTSPPLQAHVIQVASNLLEPSARHYLAADRHVLFEQFHEHLTGNILELGSESGTNFGFFADVSGAQWSGTALTHEAANTLRSQALALGFKDAQVVAVKEGNVAEAVMDLLAKTPSQSMDAVVSVLGLCKIKNTDQFLEEVHRVLKPSGWVLFYEPVQLDSQATDSLVHSAMIEVWSKVVGGCQFSVFADDLFSDGFPDLWIAIDSSLHTPSTFPLSVLTQFIFGGVQKASPASTPSRAVRAQVTPPSKTQKPAN